MSTEKAAALFGMGMVFSGGVTAIWFEPTLGLRVMATGGLLFFVSGAVWMLRKA